jgi:hypothetical protein
VTPASGVVATRPTIADLIVAVPLVVAVQLANLVVALAFVLALRLRNVASIRASAISKNRNRRRD